MNIDRALKIIIHGIYWIVYIMFSVLLSMPTKPEIWTGFRETLPHLFINLIWAFTIFYISYFYLIGYFEKKQFTKYLLSSIVISLIVSVLFLIIHKLINKSLFLYNYRIIIPPIAGTFIIAQCGSLVRGFENWFTGIRLKSEIENRNLRNELELLKSQINPHFLFNTLNNIDSLIMKSPAEASSYLITLSDMLRYMIYEATNEVVPLEKETVYLRRYINLQQIRYKKKDYIKVNFSTSESNTMVAPMLFLPFVENAFKYSCDSETMPVIDISLTVDAGTLYFRCQNQYDPERIKTSGVNGGVGLENAKRRLALLYPRKHVLQITKNQGIFIVELTLYL
jgi:two-component system, LytTR family, sensor kinase